MGAIVGLANTDIANAIFDPLDLGTCPTCEFHQALLSRSSPKVSVVPVGEGQVFFWRDPYEPDPRRRGMAIDQRGTSLWAPPKRQNGGCGQ